MNTSMRELPLVVLAILVIGCMLAILLSIITIKLYKRELLKGMGYNEISDHEEHDI